MKRVLAAAALAVIAAPAAQAVELVGGSVGLEYSSYLGGGASDFNRLSIGGSAELGFSRSFSLQADLNHANFGGVDSNATNFALHGIFHASDTSSFGAFIGRDHLSGGGSANFAGVEAGFATGGFGGEIYAASANGSGDTASFYGVSGAYAVMPNLDLGARFDGLSVDGDRINLFALTGEYKPLPEMSLTAKLGSAGVSGMSGSEAFASVGVKFNFGARQGTAFESRSILNNLPGL